MTRILRSGSLYVLLTLTLGLGLSSAQAFESLNRDKHRGQAIADVQRTDDADLVRANRDKRMVHFLVAADVQVVRILEDDESGAKHQRFYVKLSDGSEVFAVYSLEEKRRRVPVRLGVQVTLAGEFKWTRFGGLMHWLHEDTKDRRPDGYVELNGIRYGVNP